MLEIWALVLKSTQWLFFRLSHLTSCLSTLFLLHWFAYFIFMHMCEYLCACACLCMGTCLPQWLCAVQRAICGTQFSLSTGWVPEIKLMMVGLTACLFTWWAILLDFHLIFLRQDNSLHLEFINLIRLAWQLSSRDPLVSTSPMLGLQLHSIGPGFLYRCWGPASSSSGTTFSIPILE